MSSLPTIIESIDCEDVYQKGSTEEQKAKTVLNSLLNVVPTYDEDGWVTIFDWMGVRKTLGTTGSSSVYKTVYKNASIKIIMSLAKKHQWQFAKDGTSIYVYDEQFWIDVEPKIIKHFLNLTAQKLGIPEWIASDYHFIEDLYKQLEPAGFFEQMKKKNVTLLNLQNGTLHIDLKSVQMQDFAPSDFLTHQLDFKFDPNASNQLWLDFLDTVLPDKDTQKTLQQSLGYLFTKDLKLEKAIFLYGTGSNGKSVIFEILNGILNSEMITNYSLGSLTSTAGYHRTGLNNKLINYGTDITMKQMDHGVFKQLVSGEPIEVRQIYDKPFIMKNYAKLIFNLNKIDDADVESTIGFFRRMVFIPFERTISKEEQDKSLHKKILADKAGVLNWILEGVQAVLNNQEIFISNKCEDFLENFRKESNIAIRFLEEHEIKPSLNKEIKYQTMYESFKEFCKSQGEKPLSQRHFVNELKKLDFQFVRRSHGNIWFAQSHRSKPSAGEFNFNFSM